MYNSEMLTVAIAGGAVLLLVLAFVWLIILSVAASREIRRLRARANETEGQLSALMRAWASAIAVCENCGRIFFTTDQSKVEKVGEELQFYCERCK